MSNTASKLAGSETEGKRGPLPDVPNCDGRPVWEPPIFDYSDLIDEEYEKKREAVLKFTKGDVEKATLIMDLHIESKLLGTYDDWAKDNRPLLCGAGKMKFYEGLHMEVFEDHYEVMNEAFEKSYATFTKKEDGKWVIESFDDFSRRTRGVTERPWRNAHMGLAGDTPVDFLADYGARMRRSRRRPPFRPLSRVGSPEPRQKARIQDETTQPNIGSTEEPLQNAPSFNAPLRQPESEE